MKNENIKVTQKELAEFLGVNPSTVTQYKKSIVGKRKLLLMIKGLKKIKEEKLFKNYF